MFDTDATGGGDFGAWLFGLPRWEDGAWQAISRLLHSVRGRFIDVLPSVYARRRRGEWEWRSFKSHTRNESDRVHVGPEYAPSQLNMSRIDRTDAGGVSLRRRSKEAAVSAQLEFETKNGLTVNKSTGVRYAAYR